MASILKVNKLDPQSGTDLEIGSSGDSITVPSGATLDISSATLTPPATMPASSGVNLTALNASNLGSGTVPTARLGSGTASSSVFLAGDNTWASAGGGKVLQVVTTNSSTAVECTSSTYADLISADITPANTANDIIAWFNTAGKHHEELNAMTIDFVRLLRDTTEVKELEVARWGHSGTAEMPIYPNLCVLDAPSSTSSINYSIQVKRNDNTYSTFYGNGSGTNCISLVLMEIDGT